MNGTIQLTQQAGKVSQAIDEAQSDSIALAAFSGLIAHSESFLTKRAIEALIERKVSLPELYEVLLQSYLFCGFPRMLDALFDLAALVEPNSYLPSNTKTKRNSSQLAYTADESMSYEKRGRDLIQLIYGKNYHKLEHAISKMSPDVFRLMIMEGYGKTLSRSGLDVKTRELAVVAALVVDRRPRQLRAHLRGALNVGVTPETLQELFRVLAVFTPEATILMSANMLAEVLQNS